MNMNFNFFTVSASTFNQYWKSGYYKIIARCNSFIDEASPAGMKTPGGRSSSIKNSDSASESWRGNIDESVINSPQSQFTTERNGAMKFEIFLGNAQFQIPGIVHCPPFNFFNIPSRNLFKKEIVQFCIQLFRFKMNLILPMIKTTRKSMVVGLFKHKW